MWGVNLGVGSEQGDSKKNCKDNSTLLCAPNDYAFKWFSDHNSKRVKRRDYSIDITDNSCITASCCILLVWWCSVIHVWTFQNHFTIPHALWCCLPFIIKCPTLGSCRFSQMTWTKNNIMSIISFIKCGIISFDLIKTNPLVFKFVLVVYSLFWLHLVIFQRNLKCIKFN